MTAEAAFSVLTLDCLGLCLKLQGLRSSHGTSKASERTARDAAESMVPFISDEVCGSDAESSNH